MIISLLFVVSASAHQTALSYLLVSQQEHGMFSVVFKKPLLDIESDDLVLEYPKGCYDAGPTRSSREAGYITYKCLMRCGEKEIEGMRFWIHGLLPKDRGVIFRYEGISGERSESLLRQGNPLAVIMLERSMMEVLKRYFFLGIEHILLGYDHILFVLSLLMLVRSYSMLIKTVTAFTVAHSLTLASAVFGYTLFSQAYVEAMIALSIIMVARELLIKNSQTLSMQYPWLIAFFFGLIHGFGFAGVLKEIGLPEDGIGAVLLMFNLGVEAGQLIFIAAVVILLRPLKAFLSEQFQLQSFRVTAYAIGFLATFWFIERISILT